MIDELREQFLIESRDLIAEAADHFQALEHNPQATAAIDGAFRALHTLKGSVALFAMRPAEQVLHGAEDLLERVRKGTSGLDGKTTKALIDCLDQIDRWIDDFEQHGALPDNAPAAAEAYLVALVPAETASVRESVEAPVAREGWLDDLLLREAQVLAASDRPLTAFRYEADADCFFRGDDPLATARGVPGLLSLAILPRTGEWPEAASMEPFTCFSIIEGLSAAPIDALRAIFRMVPDQVSFVALKHPAEQDQTGQVASEVRVKRSFRVDPARIDALGDAVGELLVAIHGFAGLAEEAERVDRSLAAKARAYQANLDRVTGNLHLMLGAVRSVPLESGLRRLPRLVREIAESLGKSVDFSITGQDVEIDKQVVDGIFEPLLHLVRNAIDHGIEGPERRKALGKSPIGKVSLAFSRNRDSIIAELTDDGVGIAPEAMRQVAVDRGLVTAEAAASFSDSAALRLIFMPGFSTASAVTELSGRGVGMDAVQVAVEKLRGSVEVDSGVGLGTTFRLILPTNTLTTRLLVVEAAGERFGVALDQVVETVGADQAKVVPIGSGIVCTVHGRTVPVLDLATLLGGKNSQHPNAKLVLVRSGGEPVAVRVDAFAERIDSLVRPANGMLALIPGVIGSALMSDGAVLLVLDLPGLAA